MPSGPYEEKTDKKKEKRTKESYPGRFFKKVRREETEKKKNSHPEVMICYKIEGGNTPKLKVNPLLFTNTAPDYLPLQTQSGRSKPPSPRIGGTAMALWRQKTRRGRWYMTVAQGPWRVVVGWEGSELLALFKAAEAREDVVCSPRFLYWR